LRLAARQRALVEAEQEILPAACATPCRHDWLVDALRQDIAHGQGNRHGASQLLAGRRQHGQ
jgi:hypothetical protein